MSDPIYEESVSEMHHVVVAAGAMALVYYAFVRPLMSTGPNDKLIWMGLAVLVWAVIIPAIMIATGAHEDGLSGEPFFVILKLVSVCVAIWAMQLFIACFHFRGHVNTFAVTLVMNFIVIVNIGEAVMTGVKKYFAAEGGHIVDLLNAIVGFGLMAVLFYQIFEGPGMTVLTSEGSKKIRLKCNYPPWFVVSYTIWNMLFRSRLVENTNALLFFMVSLLLPIIEHFNGDGDWLQVRAATLLATIVLTLGISPGDGRIFPAYNKDGYVAEEDEKSIFSSAQKSEAYRWAMLVGAAATLGLSIWEARVQSETFLGVFTTERRQVERFDQSHPPNHATREIGGSKAHVGRQLRMHKRGAKSAWALRVNSSISVFLVGCVVVLSVLTSVLDNIVTPTFVPGETNVTKLSNVLVQNCVGSSCWFFGVTLASTFLVYATFYIVNRVSPLFSFIFIFGGLILIVPFAIAFETMDTPFEYVKLISVYVVCFNVAVFRLDNMLRQQKSRAIGYFEPGQKGWVNALARRIEGRFMPPSHFLDSDLWCWVLWWGLAINITEAAVTDISLGNYFNACAGFWLVLAQPRKRFSKWDYHLCWFAKMRESWSHILFIDESESRAAFYDMVYETDWFWVLMYTSWNLCFCLDERREHFAAVCIVLIACLVNEIPSRMGSDPHLWTQARSFTLLIRYITIAIYDPYQEFADSRFWFSKSATKAWGLTNLAICVIFSLYKLTTRSAQKQVNVLGRRAAVESDQREGSEEEEEKIIVPH